MSNRSEMRIKLVFYKNMLEVFSFSKSLNQSHLQALDKRISESESFRIKDIIIAIASGMQHLLEDDSISQKQRNLISEELDVFMESYFFYKLLKKDETLKDIPKKYRENLGVKKDSVELLAKYTKGYFIRSRKDKKL